MTQQRSILYLGKSTTIIEDLEESGFNVSVCNGSDALDWQIANNKSFNLAIIGCSGVGGDFSASYDEIFTKLKPMIAQGMQIIIHGGTGQDRTQFNYPKFPAILFRKSIEKFYSTIENLASTPRDVKKILYAGEAIEHFKIINQLELKNGHQVHQVQNLATANIENFNDYDAIIVSSLVHKESVNAEITTALKNTNTPVILYSNWDDHKAMAEQHGFSHLRRYQGDSEGYLKTGDARLLAKIQNLFDGTNNTPSQNNTINPEFNHP